MRRCLVTGLMMAGAVLAGCTLTPDYRRPHDALANNPHANGAFVAEPAPVTNDAPAGQWWHLYNDPMLDDLVRTALIHNTDLRVALASLRQADAGLAVATDARFPQASVGATAAYARDSAEEQLVPGPLSNERVYAVLGSVSYQVDLFGQVRRSIEAAGAHVDAAKAAVAATQVAVAAQTVAAYLSVCSAAREITVTRHAIDLQVESTRLAGRRYDAGQTGSLDVTRSTTQEHQLRATLPPLQLMRSEALDRLAVLTGRPLAELPAGADACQTEPVLTNPVPVGDGRALLARRPDVAMAEANLREATAELGVVTADLYPTISFGASAGSVGLMSRFNRDDTYKFSIGPLVSWTFPNRRRARAQIAGAQAAIDAAYARFDTSVLRALEEVQSALDRYAYDLDRKGDLQRARQSAQKASMDARGFYAAGRESYLPVLDADRQLAATDQALAAQQTRIANDQVQLFLALGGGWE